MTSMMLGHANLYLCSAGLPAVPCRSVAGFSLVPMAGQAPSPRQAWNIPRAPKNSSDLTPTGGNPDAMAVESELFFGFWMSSATMTP